VKATIKPDVDPSVEKYPCLKMFNSKLVVLFTEPRTGTLLWKGPDATGTVGDCCDTWAEFDFKPFAGTVELSND